MENGDFCSLDLTDRGHYEVHGGELQGQVTALSQRSFSFSQRPSSSPVANFTQPPRASTPRSFQRSIHISEIQDGRMVSSRVVVVRFTESEANVPSIQEKVKLTLGNDESYVLTNTQGNEILDSEGTTGSSYWRPNSRKVHAVESAAFRQWQHSRSLSRRDAEKSVLQNLKSQIEELLEASHGLENVSRQIQEIFSITQGAA
ncbi:uncharacterized protein LOC143712137 [Siphateles boraxobius]|uniref:uncharacterized protein LOC143712137 n=1 Tax=Siphateles boraxobius TaxID=180520 RepID=UPI0040648A25